MQCAAVKTTSGATSVPVHQTPPPPMSTTDGSPLSVVPPMIDWLAFETLSAEEQALDARTKSRMALLFIGANRNARAAPSRSALFLEDFVKRSVNQVGSVEKF